MPAVTRARMARAPRPCWVRTDGRLVRVDDAEETHIVEERQRHPANRMEAHGDQEAANAGDAAGSRPRRRPRAGCVRRTNPTQNRSTTPKKRPTRPTISPPPPPPSSPTITTSPPPPPSLSPSPPSPLPPSPSPPPPPSPLHLHHATTPNTTPNTTTTNTNTTTTNTTTTAAIPGPGSNRLGFPVHRRRGRRLCECRCLIQAPVQELEKLLDIAVGAGAVAFAYDDSSVDAVRDLADLTAWDAAIVGQLQRQVLRAIGYRVEHL
ncbi:hypothetical protein SeLEV6574_g08596 [Synchytrium endobioticum]|uniref:Uncharacterized protein n=1 Tax=Synchytrium endobioticum TaxID=286115 RepID=A0A507BY88_9FUNG|nr:hypothetical protein SeLEV6574_g08596 [Synchytrium endobioticum]